MPHPGWIEQWPGDFEEALQKALAAVLQKIPAGDILAIGFSGHMSAVVLVDASGKPVANCLTLSDNRSTAESREIDEKAGDRIFKNTGNPVLTAFSAPKLLWVQRNQPEIFSRAAHYIAPKDYLRFILCGRISAEYTDAANSLLLDRDGSWDWDLIDLLGLPRSIFPEILKPCETAGAVTPEAARRFGLKRGTPVIAGAADMACGALGTGVYNPGDAAVTIGTSATFLCAVKGPGETGRGSITYHPHAVPGAYYALGSHFNGGLALNWFSGLFSPDEKISYPVLDDLAAQIAKVPPGSGGLISLPFLVGSGSPYFSPADSAAFIGLNQTSNRGALFRSLLEGIAFNLRQTLRIFEGICGNALAEIRIAGGGVRIRGWDQIITDVFGGDTCIIQCPDASAVGAAILGGFGGGIFPSMEEAAAKCIGTGRRLSADAEAHRIYRELYELWTQAHDALRHVSLGLKKFC
jgi:xylulokinase